MPIKIQISDFAINPKNIQQEVENKYRSLSKASKTNIDKIYGSAYEFLAVLYHLWFVEKLEKSEIAAKLNVQTENVHIQLYNFSWYYSNDYVQNKQLFEDDIKKTKDMLVEAKTKALLLDLNANEHSKLKDAVNRTKQIHKKAYINLGINSGEEYARTLYYLIYVKHLSPIKLIPLFNLSFGTIQLRLRMLGLNASHEEGIASKKGRKSQNYEKSIRSGKKTRAKTQLRTFSTGSNNQDYLRTQLGNFIYDDGYLDSTRYEVIVGISNTGILGSLEIDIPIVVYDVKCKQVHRFALEYNGDYFHTAERDENKRVIAESKGWHYLEVIETSSSRYSNNPKLLDSRVHDLCHKIKNAIEAGATNLG
jgi:hypothetical protein